jgi:hypothetical protein
MSFGKQHKGQVALVLVLIMTVVSALAVSLASRSTVDTRIQQTESESVQALLFAQTGLEQLIMNPALTSGAPDSNYYAVTSELGSNSLEVGLMEIGSTVEINLIGGSNLDGFTVLWGPGSAGGQPAVFISTVKSSGQITDYAYAYSSSNGFTVAGEGTGGYAKSTGSLPFSGGEVKVRVTVLGAPALLRVVPVGSGALFPAQVRSIRSVGSVQSDSNNVKYGLQYDESSTDNVPTVFDYALFSGGSIIQ